jgi:23S rRNA (cytidine1920-2'-O)/16S rRNA (cytidine1409-2'-O)-methyltransferase
MTKIRLDQALVKLGKVPTRSQAESFIKLGQVLVNKKVATKSGTMVSETDTIVLTATEQYVSRAGLKLASVAKILGLNFKDKSVLDVGSSTGGFTDYALKHGANYVIAVDVGTNQLHPSLRGNPQIELHEQTDIRDMQLAPKGKRAAGDADSFRAPSDEKNRRFVSITPDIVVIDVSFISLREILPTVARLSNKGTQVVAMVKPQFEAGSNSKHKGIIKNDRMRRDILQDFEQWVRGSFVIQDKADSEVAGAKGNRERFYLLKKAS